MTNEKLHYEAVEKARIKAAILMSDTDKFRLFMRLRRINTMLKNAKITHSKST